MFKAFSHAGGGAAIALAVLLGNLDFSPAHASSSDSDMVVVSDKPLPLIMSAPTGPTPMSVPSGYTLHGNRIDDTHYRSDTVFYGDYTWNGSGWVLTTEVDVAFKETLNGGSSKFWALGANAYRVKGASSWSLTYGYTCAINVAGEPDHTCAYSASPSGVSGTLTPGGSVWYSFENRNSGVDYPMFAITVHFGSGKTGTGKFRGWDVCNAAVVKLCASTGNGY